MRSFKLVAAVAMLMAAVAFGEPNESIVVYTLELGGNNHADLWENNQYPRFTQGVVDTSAEIFNVENNGDDVTWAVRVSVGGLHSNPGSFEHGYPALGAANLVFDLELYDDSTGQLVAFGAAPLAPQGTENVPTGPGFWSSINDGDSHGIRGAIAPDILANAAFAIGIHNKGDAAGPNDWRTLIDPAPDGPNFDYGWYPTANGRGGVDIGNTKEIVEVDDPSLNGRLIGFGAGYKSYDYTNYRPGVGKLYIDNDNPDYGFGAFFDGVTPGWDDPLNPPAGAVEYAVFEGQISTKGMPGGTYTLKVVPSAEGTNVLHGLVLWKSATPDYSGLGSFAVKANQVLVANPDGLKFTVPAPEVNAEIVARHVFYNQCAYDGNKAAIDPGPIAGANNDDGDAVDTTKVPLMLGGGTSTFANYTTYAKGLNGLVYDIKNLNGAVPTASDFVFTYMGRTGAMAPQVKVPSAVVLWPGAGVDGSDRLFISFENESIVNGWLKVEVTTGFGAPAEEHWWGNVQGEAQNDANNMIVNALDLSLIKANYTNPGQAPVSWVWDFDKNRTCNALDASYAKGKFNNPPSTAVLKITR
ncbi:MAG TPA: hypothetical protein PLE87_04630 [Phycisphaerae bacterium]|nr:hypothetical protein [Phycisphaerae bacterium]